MKLPVNLSANFTLDETKNRCEGITVGGFQLEIISTTTVMENDKPVAKNKAVFHNALDNILNELTFIAVGTDDPEVITKKMKDEGRTPICDSEIFVEKKITRVLVFGKVA